MNIYIFLLLCIPAASAVTHSLQYFYTATSGISDFPEFIDVGIVNGEVISLYDSNLQRKVPKQKWMEDNFDQQYWDSGTERLKGTEPVFKVGIQNIKSRFNETGGVHTFQYMYGCEWDDETGVTEGMRQIGYDGEDFVVYDMKTFTWIAPTPQAEITQRKWNSDTALLASYKNYITQECLEWLKKYVGYGKSTLERKVSPEVSLLQKEASSPVTCHATGFYPSGVMVTWQKDGQEMHEDVELGETVPNQDGTFQSSIKLTVKAEEWKKNPKSYTCVVEHKSEEKDIILQLDPTVFKTNSEKSGNLMAIIIGCVVGVLVLAAVIGLIAWKKSKSGYGKTNTSDTDSDNSKKPAVKD